MHVGEPVITACVAISQALMIHAEQMQNGSVNIVHMHLVHRCLESEIITLTISRPTLGATAREEHAETVRVVIATIAILTHRRAAKLATPNNQCVIKQAALLQITDQRSNRPVDVRRQFAGRRVMVRVRVPGLAVAIINLNKAHSTLHQTAGHEAAIGEMALAIHLTDTLRLQVHIKGIRRRRLHSESRFHRLNPAIERDIRTTARREMLGIQRLHEIELLALIHLGHALIVEPRNHLLGVEIRVVDVNALMLRRQKRAAPQNRKAHRPAGTEHYIGRQVGILIAKAVAHP